jgi:methionyl-tRNA synthetase
MPEKCAEALANFGITEQVATTLDSGFDAGRHVQAGKSLFPRVIQEPSIPVKEEHKETVMENKPTPPTPESPFIEYEDFAKMQLKTAHIISAERVPNADKLLRMEIDMGTEKRQIVAGIAEDYKPEDVIGKTIIVVANLKPRKIRGIESNGMLLAAHGEKGLSLVIVDRPVEPGKPVT